MRGESGAVRTCCSRGTGGPDGRGDSSGIGEPVARGRHAARAPRRRSHSGGAQNQAGKRCAHPNSPRGLPRWTRCSECRGAVHRGGEGVRDGALLAGRAAAYLWGLIKAAPPQPEVLTPRDRRVPGVLFPGFAARRSRDAGNRTVAIPVTTRASDRWWIWHLHCPGPALARACHEAGRQYRTTPRQVESGARPTTECARQAKAATRILGGEVPVTLSRLEAGFLRPTQGGRAAAAGDQSDRRRRPRRLQVVGASADGGAGQLPVSRVAPRLGKGHPPREGSPAPG